MWVCECCDRQVGGDLSHHPDMTSIPLSVYIPGNVWKPAMTPPESQSSEVQSWAQVTLLPILAHFIPQSLFLIYQAHVPSSYPEPTQVPS